MRSSDWSSDVCSSELLRSGQFDAAPGFEHWLLKFDGVGKDMELGTGADYSRIEYAYHLMASTAGIAMEPCRLLEENDRAHLHTRSFDRDGRSAERSVGEEGISTCRYRGVPDNYKTKSNIQN